MSESKKVITVLGATGAQGGGVVDALLAKGEFKVRGVTRDVKSEKAQSLAQRGVEVVAGNVEEPATIKKALDGAYGVFAMTTALEHLGKEFEIGKSLVDAAKESKVTHFIWSTLANCEKESKGKYKAVAGTQKAQVEEYARKVGFKYHTYVVAPFYFSNFGNFYKPKKNEDGSLSIPIPVLTLESKFSMGDIHDLGLLVAAAFSNPKGWGNGDVIIEIADDLSGKEVFDILSQHLNTEVKLETVSREEFGKAGGVADQIAELHQYFEEYHYYPKSFDYTSGHKAAGKPLKSFKEWVKETNLYK